jgi:dihydrofolate reductase
MKSLIAFNDVTLDGFMAAPGNDLSFMVHDPKLDEEFPGKLMQAADLIVLGRKVFFEMGPFWIDAPGELAQWMNETPKIVLSKSPGVDVSFWQNATLAAGDGAEQVRPLKAGKGKSIATFGGVETCRGGSGG